MIAIGDLRIGRLRDRLSILKPTHSEDDATGELTESWTAIASDVPAMIQTTQAEQEAATKQARVTRYSIAIRYRADLENQTGWRVLIDESPCELTTAIDPDRRRRWLLLTAVEVIG